MLVALVLAAGCGEDTPLYELPEGTVIGKDAPVVFGDERGLIWFERVPTEDPLDPLTRLWEYRDGAATMLDETDENVFIDTRGHFVLRDGDALLWGAGSAFIGCGLGRWVRPGEPAVPVELWGPTGDCRAVPIALQGGVLWAAIPTTSIDAEPAEGITVTRVELATDTRTPWRELPGRYAAAGLAIGDDGFVLAYPPFESGESRMIGFPLTSTDPYARWIGPTIRDVEGIVRAGDRLAWIDGGAFGEPARVMVAAPDHARPASTTVEARATLPASARGLQVAGDALWTTPLVRTEIALLPPRELWRIGPDGRVTVFPAFGDVLATGVVGGELWAAVAQELPDGERHTTELVRVDARGALTRYALDRDVDLISGTADALVVRAVTVEPGQGKRSELVRYPLAAFAR